MIYEILGDHETKINTVCHNTLSELTASLMYCSKVLIDSYISFVNE